MRQIPTSGAWCGECYTEWRGLTYWCLIYNKQLRYNAQEDNFPRLPDCLRDKPQVLTEDELGDIFHNGMKVGYDNAIALASEGKEVKP